MKLLASIVLGLAFAGTASSQTLDCAALQNSPFAEPEGYASACGIVAPVPSPGIGDTARAPTSNAFTLDVRGQAPRLPNTLYGFTLNNFPVQTTVGVITATNVFGMDFDPTGTTLYGVTGSAGVPALTLGTINTTTGTFTTIAAVTGVAAGQSTTGVSIHPITGAAYLSTSDGVTSQLHTLNLATGAATLIGQMGTEALIIDIAMNCNGEMYAHGIATDALFSVNTTTGATTLIGTHGLAANFAQGMDFDNDDGTLYAFIYTGTGTNRFGSFNLATGAFTALATDNPLGEYEGAIPTQCSSASTLTYNPTTAAGVTFPAGPAGSASASIGITSTGATGSGQTALTGCAISGPGAASFGAVTTTPANGVFNAGTTSGSIDLSCTRGAAVATASLSCTETATPTVAGSPFTRTWALTCPAVDAVEADSVPVPAMGNFATWTLVLSALGFGLLTVGTRLRS